MKQRMIVLSRIYYAIVMRYHREKVIDGQNSNGKKSLVVGASAKDNVSGMHIVGLICIRFSVNKKD